MQIVARPTKRPHKEKEIEPAEVAGISRQGRARSHPCDSAGGEQHGAVCTREGARDRSYQGSSDV